MAVQPSSRNPDRTRRRLLRAAIRLFSARGFHGIAVDQIVAAARVNKRMVYHYFGSKEAIYRAALVEVYNCIVAVEFSATENDLPPREKLVRLMRNYFTFLDATPEFTQLIQWENLERGKHIAKHRQLLSKDPFLDRFRQIINEGISIGQFRPDLNIPHLLIHCIGLCFIYHSNRFSLSQGLHMDLGDPKEREKGLEQILNLIFEGICITAPAGGATSGIIKPVATPASSAAAK
jgi:TetR/AcrR family transcriptional regulator